MVHVLPRVGMGRAALPDEGYNPARMVAMVWPRRRFTVAQYPTGYRTVRVLRRGEQIAPLAFLNVTIAVDEIPV